LVDDPDGALGAPPTTGTGGFPPFAGLPDDEATPSAGMRSQSADGPGFTSGALASKDGSLPGFSADGTLCSSRCANTVGRAAPVGDTAALCAIGTVNQGALTPFAAPDNPGTKTKPIAVATISMNAVDLVLN
jgi:hypothetical protein